MCAVRARGEESHPHWGSQEVTSDLLSTAGEKVYNLSSAKLKNITKLNILHMNLHKPEALQYIIYNDKDII